MTGTWLGDASYAAALAVFCLWARMRQRPRFPWRVATCARARKAYTGFQPGGAETLLHSPRVERELGTVLQQWRFLGGWTTELWVDGVGEEATARLVRLAKASGIADQRPRAPEKGKFVPSVLWEGETPGQVVGVLARLVE